MKEKYVAPEAGYVLPETLLDPDYGDNQFGKGSNPGGNSTHTGAKENMFVWDDDIDGEDDNWGYSGF